MARRFTKLRLAAALSVRLPPQPRRLPNPTGPLGLVRPRVGPNPLRHLLHHRKILLRHRRMRLFHRGLRRYTLLSGHRSRVHNQRAVQPRHVFRQRRRRLQPPGDGGPHRSGRELHYRGVFGGFRLGEFAGGAPAKLRRRKRDCGAEERARTFANDNTGTTFTCEAEDYAVNFCAPRTPTSSGYPYNPTGVSGTIPEGQGWVSKDGDNNSSDSKFGIIIGVSVAVVGIILLLVLWRWCFKSEWEFGECACNCCNLFSCTLCYDSDHIKC
ncbi:hypothetical protein TIFTF001_002252 [Ficus carica]|uniref:Uncharacterized protein n=1 Tax=Ficus carica TaxID=3494 RepID=A0AA87ZCF3_FICCA|nr:hypothetical protein TIFTF001_002252 [Ficus carica]